MMNVPVKPPPRREAMRIAGKRVETDGAVEVFNPYTNEVVGTVPAARPEHVRGAFAKAKAFRPTLTRYERQQILQRTAETLRDRREEFARLITAESGLCWKDSLYEASRAYDVWSFAAQLTIKDDGEIYSCDISPNGKSRKIYTMRTPLLGVISAITPFNHPLNMVSHKLAPAIATNNRLVLKPTELTPLTALALADVLYEAGLPPEMLSVVTGNPATMGDAMITDPDADLVTFTGSVRVGKHIAATAGYKRLVLELGGNDPLIVMEDADLDRAAELAVQGATKNSGQRCTAVKRIIVVESVADDFSELVREETFGPVIPIIRCPDDIASVIKIANSTAYGLSSGVCTNRLDYITRFVAELEVGTVNVWEVPGYRIEMSPFGGIKDSGLGYKEGVVEAMKSFTNVRTYSLPWPA